MKTARDPRFEAYIEKSATFAQPILRHLRALVHQACPEAGESIKWSMPWFVHAGGLLCGMAAFKAHCTFGFWHQGMTAVVAGEGGRTEEAMGAFGRIATLDDLPKDAVMLRYIKQAAKLNESNAPARPRPAKKTKPATLVVPPDLADGLKKNKAAAAAFAKFSPSKRKDYIEWIAEAKREETRRTRLATALTWIAAGKSRNWKYENC